MKFLLVCPLDPESAETAQGEGQSRAKAEPLTGLQNRLDVRTVRLVQNRRELESRPADPTLLPDSGLFTHRQATVTAAGLVEIDTKHVMVLEVSAPEKPSLPVVALETLLSEAAAEFARIQASGIGKPKWVNRTLLLDDEPAPAGWFVGQTREIEVEIASSSQRSKVTLGWANNAVSRWSLYGETEKSELVKGLVDAQYIWTEAEHLSEDSLTELEAHAFRLNFIRRPARTRGKAGQLLVALALHNVAYDDVLLNLQGYRREVAKSSLDVWQYPELMARISRRITEVHRLEMERVSQNSAKYENLVGNVLLGVGLISAAQLVLAVIQTAFSGGTSDVPGGRGDGGLMAYFRQANIDIWMWGSLSSVVIVFVVLILLRSRVR